MPRLKVKLELKMSSEHTTVRVVTKLAEKLSEYAKRNQEGNNNEGTVSDTCCQAIIKKCF